MTGELVTAKSGVLESARDTPGLPSLIVRAGGGAERRYLEFFAAQIRNRNTREAYLRAVRDFLGWVETEARIEDLLDIEPLHVASRRRPARPRASSSSSRRCAICSTGWSPAMSCTPTRHPSSGDRSFPTPRARRRS